MKDGWRRIGYPPKVYGPPSPISSTGLVRRYAQAVSRYKAHWNGRGGAAVADYRLQKRMGCFHYTLEKPLKWQRRFLRTGFYRWRPGPAYSPIYWGLTRMGKPTRSRVTMDKGLLARPYVLFQWRWILTDKKWNRLHPDIWFFAFPAGGFLIIPDHVLASHWHNMRLDRAKGCWQWKFWERWDVVSAYPNLPDDLVEGHVPPMPAPAVLPAATLHCHPQESMAARTPDGCIHPDISPASP